MQRLQLDRRYAVGGRLAGNWARAVLSWRSKRRGASGVRPKPGSRPDTYFKLWRLDEGSSEGTAASAKYGRHKRMLLCHVRSAEAKARRLLRRRLRKAGRPYGEAAVDEALLTEHISPKERDAAGMVHYARDDTVIPAIVGSYASRYLIGGSGARSGTWVSNQEVAEWMGIGSGRRADRASAMLIAKRRRLTQRELQKAIASAVFLPTGRAVMSVALDKLQKVRRREGVRTNRVVTSGAMYAGLGTLGLALRDVVADRGLTTRCAWVAEREPKLARVARESLAATRVHGDAEANEMAQAEKVDIVHAGWPCVKLSTGRRTTGSAEERRKEATSSVARAFKAVKRYADVAKPSVIVLENVVGFATHYRPIFKAFNRALRRMPYRWERCCTNATRWGACHRRRRLLWVGQRRA